MKKCITLFLCFFPLVLLAQTSGHPFAFIHTLKTGSVQEKHITAIFQDSRGFIWLGTRKGICRYDGVNFNYYNTVGKNGISNWVITSITEDKKGNIWFGTENGLNRLDPSTNTIIHYYAGNGAGTIPFNWCNALLTDKNKNLWLSTEKGMARYDEESNSFINYPVKLFDKDERINKYINEITEDDAGNFWLGTSLGVKKFNPQSRTYTSYHKTGTEKYISENIISSLFIDYTQTVWAGSFSGELLRFDRVQNRFEKIASLNNNPQVLTIEDINEVKSGDQHFLVLATTGGLYYLHNGISLSAPQLSAEPGKLSLKKIYTDRQQNTWAGGENGLFKLNRNSFAFQWIRFPVQRDKAPVFHIIPSVINPSLFYLTTTNGWWVYSLDHSITGQADIPFSKEKILEYINDWETDENGYWFTSVKGFGYYNERNKKLTDLSGLVFQYSGQYSTGYIVKVAASKYWITMRRSGILEYDAATQSHRQLFADKSNPDHVYSNDITDMKIHPNGQVYFISAKKLYEVHPGNYSYKIYSAPLMEDSAAALRVYPYLMCISADNKLLVNNDLKVFQLADGLLKPFFPKSGFTQEQIGRIQNSSDGFWVLSDQQVFKTNQQLQQWQSLQEQLGWPDSTRIFDIYNGANNTVLFASDNALGILKEPALLKPGKPAAVLISSVKHGNQQAFLPLADEIIKTSFKNSIEFDLAPVDFQEGNKLYYKLQGWDNEWRLLNNTTRVRYEQLPPGNYSFTTKAVNTAGAESEETIIQIRVVPPFYRTWWFITLVILVIAGIAYGLYTYNLRKALQLEKMRTHIATDLHDDIGATLSSISMYSESIKTQVKDKLPHLEFVLDKMGENSREMVTGMSDIVWAINPDNDSGEKLVQRMKNYATDMCAVKNIRLHFSTHDKIVALNLSPEKRKNIYLVFKEAVNNAVKYSGAKNLWVSLLPDGKYNSLTIKDDGEGFDTTTVRHGNGLKNMQMRANEIKAKLRIVSQINDGTQVQLTV